MNSVIEKEKKLNLALTKLKNFNSKISNIKKNIEILDEQKAHVLDQKRRGQKDLDQIAIVVDDFADDPRVMASRSGASAGGSMLNTLLVRGRHMQISTFMSVQKLRLAGRATVPTSSGLERATNPFVRPDSAELQAVLNLSGADEITVFAETRRRKDHF